METKLLFLTPCQGQIAIECRDKDQEIERNGKESMAMMKLQRKMVTKNPRWGNGKEQVANMNRRWKYGYEGSVTKIEDKETASKRSRVKNGIRKMKTRKRWWSSGDDAISKKRQWKRNCDCEMEMRTPWWSTVWTATATKFVDRNESDRDKAGSDERRG